MGRRSIARGQSCNKANEPWSRIVSIKKGEEEASRTWSLKETLKHLDAIQLGGRFKSDNDIE